MNTETKTNFELLSNEERMKMLQDIRDHLFWTGNEKSGSGAGEFQAWVDFLDTEIVMRKWFIENMAELEVQ